METASIKITAEPIDDQRCKFVVSVPVLAGSVRRFTSADDAKGSPLAAAIFAIPDLAVAELIVSGNIVTVVKQSPTPWQAVGKSVGSAIRGALAGDVPPVAASPQSPSSVSDDALYEQVAKVFDEQVNPMVARHGGNVELIDVQDAVVLLRMGGGCQGCGMADVTLRQGIEGMLAQLVPAVRGILDITDHTSGANPYFQASKK
ncbi:MAG TPA: NifU family protein [Gemmatimonadales bacterium]|nr:NifU family protein [Gemmatimonadales bacterium]